MSRNHIIISSIVTVIISIIFFLFVLNHDKNFFVLSEEYQLIPDGFVLPKGCDVKIDMQTGETFAKLPKEPKSNSIITVSDDIKEEEDIAANKSKYPEYKNITKSRIQSRVSSDQMKLIDSAISNLNSESSWEYLEEEAAAMEIGLAILESQNFVELKKFLAIPDGRALKIVANCLQNNPLAIEKFLELKIHLNELPEILKLEKLSKDSFKKLLRIVESVITEFDFIKENRTDIIEDIKRHFKEHQDEELKARYTEFY